MIDSGSQCCVWPAKTGDVIDRSVKLQTVDGSPFDCYGRKELTIKINRKQYTISAVVAKVKAPILGWNFIRKYNLDLVWGEFGDIYLRDKRAKIQTLLEHVALPHKYIPRLAALEVVQVGLEAAAVQAEFLAFGTRCVATVGTIPEGKEVHDKKYEKLINKYKSILTPNFSEASTKHGVEHAIVTNGPPCKAKTRPLLPGSKKAVEGKKPGRS